MWHQNREELEIAARARANDELSPEVLADLHRQLMSRRPDAPAAEGEERPVWPDSAPTPPSPD